MNIVKRLIIFLVCCIIFIIPCTVSALDSGLETESLSVEEIAEISKHRTFEKITSYTPMPAQCFDVRNDHMVVVGATMGPDAVIVIYNAEGDFQYGFKTSENGSFRVMWSGNSIAYYSIRGNRLYTINGDGVIIGVKEVVSSSNNSAYDQKVLLSTTRTVDDCTYRMTNDRAFADGFASSFKKIIRTKEEETTVVYDAGSKKQGQMAGIVAMIVFFVAFMVVGIVIFVKKHSKNVKEQR